MRNGADSSVVLEATSIASHANSLKRGRTANGDIYLGLEGQGLTDGNDNNFEDSEGTHVAGLKAIPDGGFRAWTVVLGALCVNIGTFGLINSQGVIQQYLVTPGGPLQSLSDSQIGWIFSVMLFFVFLGGAQVGSVFDVYGLKCLVIPGSIGYVASIMILSVCKNYYQFMLGFSVLGGISCSMIFNITYTVLGHWFYKHRGLVTGIAASGGGIGGVVLPIVLDKLIPKLGFGWAVRICGFIIAGLLLVGCLTLESREERRQVSWRDAMIDFTALKEKKFTFCVIGIFCLELAYFIPILYLASYARAQGLTLEYSNSLVSYLNLASIAGRVLPGYFADRYGVYNVVIFTCFMSGLLCLCVWLPAGTSKAGITTFTVLFGVSCGSTIGLVATTIAAICETRYYGKRYGTTYSIASIAALIGPPIAGSLTNHNYLGLIVFSGMFFILGAVFLLIARYFAVGFRTRF